VWCNVAMGISLLLQIQVMMPSSSRHCNRCPAKSAVTSCLDAAFECSAKGTVLHEQERERGDRDAAMKETPSDLEQD